MYIIVSDNLILWFNVFAVYYAINVWSAISPVWCGKVDNIKNGITAVLVTWTSEFQFFVPYEACYNFYLKAIETETA